MKFVARWLICAVAAGIAFWLVPGIDVVASPPYLAIGILALFLALINVSLKPLLQAIALPFTILTFGIFYLVVNTALLYLAAWLAGALFGVSLVIAGFGSAFLASLVISIVTVILNALTGAKRDR
ncbi:MAG: phage holin family protein [Coriobacteriales bacterium]|jgi:putative membrane protein|nr:phage holin family protein [Coriobacteriales bacterium]